MLDTRVLHDRAATKTGHVQVEQDQVQFPARIQLSTAFICSTRFQNLNILIQRSNNMADAIDEKLVIIHD
jgi:hypothetical protein